MIIKFLSNVNRYYKMYFRLNGAFERIESIDFDSIKSNTYEVDGEEPHITLANSFLNAHKDTQLKTDKKYIDVQISLLKARIMGWKSIEKLQHCINTYNKERDFILLNNVPTSFITVQPKQFVIFSSGRGTHVTYRRKKYSKNCDKNGCIKQD